MTSSSLTTTRPAPIFTACTNTNVVSTTAVIPPRAHGSVHYVSSPFPTQTLVLPNIGPISEPTGQLTPFAATTSNVAQPGVNAKVNRSLKIEPQGTTRGVDTFQV